MAGEAQLTEKQRKGTQSQLLELRSSLGRGDEPASWQKVTDVLNRHATKDTERVTQETVRKMGELAVGGVKIARLVQKHLGELPDDQREHRFPSKFPAAAILRGLISDEAIEAMLVEDHKGSIEDPGKDFWIKRARFWEADRQRLKREIETEIPPELAEEPPLEPRKRNGKDHDGKGKR